MTLSVTSDVIATLVAQAARAHPDECCGILLGHGEAVEEARAAPNVAEDRMRRFEIDPATLLAAHREARQGARQVLGYYHSHPGGDPAPSATDRALASGDGRIWAIVFGGDVTFWRDAGAAFTPLSYREVDG